MGEHSPLPWTVRRSSVPPSTDIQEVFDAERRDVRVMGFGLTGGARAAANAELIVRAVNAHDALVAALKSARGQLEIYEDVISGESFNDTQINAALALAEAHS